MTKKDLKYKPDAFEQAKFEYSPLGKVFTDGLDKSDRNEGLLKRLKNIEDRNNNQLLAIENILRPAIKGENNGGFRSNDVNDEYKTIQDFKQELSDKNILDQNAVEKFDNKVNKWKQTEDKKIVYKIVDTKVSTKKFNIYKIFENYLNKSSDYDGIDMIDLDWMIDKDGYKETAEEVGVEYMKGNNNNELKLIKGFITKINNGVINNKNKARNKFRELKQKVTNDRLRQDLINYLEIYLFEEDIEPEEKYEESIAESVKTRRENKETDRDTNRTFAPQDSSINLDDFTYGENYDALDEEDRELLRNMSKEGKGLKILTNKQMLNRLPILLAQIQAGNNSKKLKNELRQIFYSLHRLKALTKTVYNNLINVIRAEH